jgi:DNA polymerase-3 subunit beta
MKILCDRQQLSDVFGVAATITPLKTPKPIAKNALLRADEDGLTVLATDFEMSAQLRLDSVKVKEPGSVLVPAKEMAALLREITDPTVTLESEEFRCTLKSGGGEFVLVGDDPEQFPEQIRLEKGHEVKISTPTFLDMFRKTAFAAAREDSRYAVNGLLIQCKDSSMRLVGTDGRRLAMCYTHLDTDVPEVESIVPNRALQALARAIPEGSKEELGVVFSPNQAGFSCGKGGVGTDFLLVTQLLDSRFPDYEAVIPKVADTTIEISKSLLEANLRRVAILSSGEVRVVRFHFSSSSLELSAESSGVGRADVVMDVDVKGAGGSIGFNPDYVLEALKVTEQDTIRVDMTDDDTPAKFTLGEAFTYVLMPVSGA